MFDVDMLSYLDFLPEEVIDVIVLFADLDTAIVMERPYCIAQFLRRKRNVRLLDWAVAAKTGKISRIKYMMANGINKTHDAALIHLALINGHLDCARWLWIHREEVKRHLWKKRHQRIHNHLVKESTLGQLITTGKHEEARWYLDATNYRFDMKALFSTTGKYVTDAQLAKRVLDEAGRMVNVDRGTSAINQICAKVRILRRLNDGTYTEWVKDLVSKVPENLPIHWEVMWIV